MGSVLKKNGITIWPRDIFEMYDLLIGHHTLLTYSGEAADETEIMDRSTLVGLPVLHLYTRIINTLSNIQELRNPDSIEIFSYDWREDFNLITGRFKELLKRKYKIEYDSNNTAKYNENYIFYLLGHSTGGVIVFLSIIRQLLHIDNIEKAILLATPLAGSPNAFRSTFDFVQLPLSKRLSLMRVFRKNAPMARENMHVVLRTCPAIYYLMPPSDVKYVTDYSSQNRFNPLDSGFFDSLLVDRVKRVHSEISNEISSRGRILQKVFLLFGTGLETDFEYIVICPKLPHQPYEIFDGRILRLPDGDETVSEKSALYYGGLNGISKLYRFMNKKHLKFCNSRDVCSVIETLIP